MLLSNVIEFDKISGNALLVFRGNVDYKDNDKKIVKLFELLILEFPIEIEFDIRKKELTLCEEINKIDGIVIIQKRKKELQFGYRVTIEMTLNSDGLLELIKFFIKHDNGFGFDCMSNGVFGVINDHDDSLIQVSKLIFEKNKEDIKAILEIK